MRQYLVNFYKVVTDDHGHDRSILQHQALVRARSEVSALFEAKAMFREAMGVADWRLRADACEAVTLADVAA
ncbi:neuroendocrine-specific golgi family protein P55 (NESP55) [Methylobacterium sp. Leaf456]|nr:neuroendocrine-specific golgi family protein P55 (NESP55) [Methylobacterium sp. Leaf456]